MRTAADVNTENNPQLLEVYTKVLMTSNKLPEICLKILQQKVWVECVCASVLSCVLMKQAW